MTKFRFCDSMVNDYLRNGYTVFEGIVPATLLQDLRREADKARVLAREVNGRQTQRIQPISRYAEQIDQRPFQDYCELPELLNAMERLLGPGYSHGGRDIMGLLIEPLDRPWNVGWHRDGVVEVPPDAYDETVQACLAEVWFDLRYFNQVNCAIYADSCTWYVPGSHLRQHDLPGESQSTGDTGLLRQAEKLTETEAERFWLDHCKSMPGAVQVHLQAGDFMIYRNLAWHTGNYITYQPRATIHDAVLWQGTGDWPRRWAQTKREARERLTEKSDAPGE